MHIRKLSVFAFFPLLVAFFASIATAQTNQGSIAGNVTDPSGALVSSAKITAKSVNTGATYETVSTVVPEATVSRMSTSGTYDVTVTAQGFKTATLNGVAGTDRDHGSLGCSNCKPARSPRT